MDNRFGLKDFVLSLLLIVLIISVWLAMKQYDRQWEVIDAIDRKLDEQTRELTQLRRTISSGVVATHTPSQGISPQTDNNPFERVNTAQAQKDFAVGDWLVDAFSGGLAKLTPLLSGDLYASIIQNHVLDSLATRNPDTLQWQGLLAKGWQISDDGMTITFQLRDGITFSDGTPLTADDVVFTFDLIMNEEIAAPRHRAYFRTIERIEKIGTLEVTFHYREPYFEAFELAASFTVLPKHFYSQFSPEAFNQSVGLLLGSGPYRLEDPTNWKPGKLIQLVRNDRYWGVPPAFDKLVYKEITNDVARLTAFRNGDIDLFAAQPEQYRAMLVDKALAERANHYEYLSPIGGYRYIAWNQRRNDEPTRFADKRVRQAMTMLTDRAQLVQEVMLGYAVPATGPFNPNSKQQSPAVKLWPYDVDAAKKLLSQAGFEDRDGDGVLESETGQPFQFKLTYPSGNDNYKKMSLFLKDAYAKAGIVVEPDPLEWSVFTERLRNKDYEAITLGWTSGIETDIYQMFHSSQMLAGGDNFMSYANEELDSTIDVARLTVDESKRIPLWHRCHDILHEDQPYTFLFFGKSLRFIDNRINNVEMVKLGLNPNDEWWVPRAKQRWTQ